MTPSCSGIAGPAAGAPILEPPAGFDFLVKKPAIVQEFPILIGRDFENFIAGEARRLEITAAPTTVSQLAAALPGDSWGAISELKKIALTGRPAEVSGVKKMDFFQSILALRRAGNIGFSLPLLERLLSREEHAAIFNVLASLVPPEEKARFADYDIGIKSGVLDYDLALLASVLK